MNARFVILMFLAVAFAKQVAFVDLSAPPRSEQTGPRTFNVRGSRVYDGGLRGPQPGTPPVTLRLTRVTTIKDGTALRDIVEVVMTNAGRAPISIPIGTDATQLLAATEKDRRSFEFSVTLAKSGRIIATATSASDSGHPESSAVLQPGDTAVFWLPAGSWLPSPPQEGEETNPEVRVSVSLNRNVLDKGKDWTELVGEPVHSQNTLPLPHVAKVELIR